MQTRGVFPELNSGRSKKPAARKHTKTKFDGVGGFSVPGKGPRKTSTAPKNLNARRNASHAKAYGC